MSPLIKLHNWRTNVPKGPGSTSYSWTAAKVWNFIIWQKRISAIRLFSDFDTGQMILSQKWFGKQNFYLIMCGCGLGDLLTLNCEAVIKLDGYHPPSGQNMHFPNCQPGIGKYILQLAAALSCGQGSLSRRWIATPSHLQLLSILDQSSNLVKSVSYCQLKCQNMAH